MTTVTTYLPVVAHGVTDSAFLIGLIIALEGVFALWLPLLAGSRSDRLRTRFGGRLPFVMAGAPLVAGALVLLAFARSIPVIALVVAIFFAGYFVAYEPYRAMYPDLVDDEAAGRGQSTQALWRGGGTGLALVGGGMLLALGDQVPFLVAAAVMAGAMGAFLWFAVRGSHVADRERRRERDEEHATVRESLRFAWRHGPIRMFLGANGLWELSLSALKTFAFLYITVGLDRSRTTAAAVIGAVAVIILIVAPFAGKLGDRFGTRRVLTAALPVYGIGLALVPLLAGHLVLVAVILPFVAIGGAVLMTLPYALLIPLMPADRHGEMTGLYGVSRGIGAMLGPLLGGAAVSVLAGPLSGSEGYAAMWWVCGGAVLASLPLLRRMEDAPR